MLNISGKKFAKTDSEFIESLFQNGGTCCGFYRKRKGGIAIYDMQRNPRVFIVSNTFGECFAVSMTRSTTGNLFYMHGLADNDCSFIGVEKMTYAAQKELYTALFNEMEE